MTNLGDASIDLKAGEKIAQMVPVPVLTGPVQEVESLEGSERAAKEQYVTERVGRKKCIATQKFSCAKYLVLGEL